MNYSPYSFFIDLGLMSILLVVGVILRAKVRIFQVLFFPDSMIAGLIGLVLGKHFLNILPFSDKLTSYPYLFIIIVFGALFLGKVKIPSFKKIVNEVGDTFAFNQGVEFAEFGITLTIGYFLVNLVFLGIHLAFPLGMPGFFLAVMHMVHR